MTKILCKKICYCLILGLIFNSYVFIFPLSATDSVEKASIIKVINPVTSIDPSFLGLSKGSIAFVKQDIILKFKVACADGLSVLKTYYKIDDAKDFVVYFGPVEISKTPFKSLSSGKHTIYYYSIDSASSIEPVKSAVIYLAGGASLGSAINYPNPFAAGRENTTIEYNIEKASDVTVRIYDLFGGMVWQQDYKIGGAGGTAGVNQIAWDGKNGSGETVANGGYLCYIQVKSSSGTTTLKRKIGVIK